MSTIFKKNEADKMAFKHNPKSFLVKHTTVAKEFVHMQDESISDFKVADVIAQLSGIESMRKENVEKQVEGTVLERLKEIQEQAYKQAYNLGLLEGAEKAFVEKKQEFEMRLASFDEFLKETEHLKVHLLQECEVALMKIVYNLASRIAMREVGLEREPIMQLLNSIVLEVQSADSITIKLSPNDFNFIEELRKKNVKDCEKLERVKFLSQENISDGGCFVETNYGEIDASIEQRVAKAWSLIEQKLPKIKKDTTT